MTDRERCHEIVDKLSDDAVADALCELKAIEEFYRTMPASLPEPEPPRSFKAKVIGSYTVPVYPVEEE